MNWHKINWKHAFVYVSRIQEELTTAYKDSQKVQELQRQLVQSFEARALAVRRVCNSSGSKTPGIDRIVFDTPLSRFEAILQLGEIIKEPNSYKASPVRRIYLPKPGTNEKRPLGIPTMIDRALQATYHLAIDPVVEANSDRYSYGFRKGRSAQDAIVRVRTLLDKPSSPRYVLDGDIEKCFDKISHRFLMANTPICDKHILKQWLESGVLEDGIFSSTLEGTPQGGVISPLLCNIALNGFEGAISEAAELHRKTKRWQPKVNVVRYADDFLVTARSSQILEEIKLAIERFLAVRGLRLKETKTRIVNVREGFNFLGFRLERVKATLEANRKQRTVFRTLPTKRNEESLIRRIKEQIDKYRNSGTMDDLIININPLLRGWAEYYRISSHSRESFERIGSYIWKKMWITLRKKHTKRNREWILKTYIHPLHNYQWRIGVSTERVIFEIASVVIYKMPPLKSDLNPYIIANSESIEKRKQNKLAAKFRAEVYRKWKHRCSYCETSLYNDESIELHHLIPRSEGGKYTLENIAPMHKTCHQSITYGKNLTVGLKTETSE
jgi:RNA-directed DNA polymerase